VAGTSEVNTGVLLAVFIEATLLSFSGFGSLPILRDDLVVRRHVLTDDDLNRAVTVARITPGAMGSYIVAVGYAVNGWTGAAAGWLAMSAPAFLVIPILIFLDGSARSARWVDAADAVILASAALVLTTATTLIRTAASDTTSVMVAVLSLIAVLATSVPTIWLIAGAAAATALMSIIQ
jgi:chromate transporter